MPGQPPQNVCVPRGAAPRGGGSTKTPPNMALLEGRAEEQGSFGELKVKVAGGGCGERSEGFGDPAGTLSPGGGSVPRSWAWGGQKQPVVVFWSPNRSRKESWGNFNQLPKQTEARGGNEVPAPAAGSSTSGSAPAPAPFPRCVPGPALQGTARGKHPGSSDGKPPLPSCTSSTAGPGVGFTLPAQPWSPALASDPPVALR